MSDRLDRGVEALRAAEPAPAPPELAASIVAAYEREFAAARRRRATRRAAAWLAAAAAVLLGIAGVWIWRPQNADGDRKVGEVVVAAPSVAVPSPAVPSPAVPSPAVPSPAPLTEDAAIAEALAQARIRGMRHALSEIAAAPERIQPKEPGPADGASAKRATDPTIQKIAEVANLTGEPVAPLFRLVAARRFEDLDRGLAASRYREILQDFPSSSAASVARARLQSLNP